MQVFLLKRLIPLLVITFKLAVDSVSSNNIFALFLFLFIYHYLKNSVHGPCPKPFYKNKKSIHGPGPWQGLHRTGPKWASMDPWSMFCPLDHRIEFSNLNFPITHLPAGRLTCANSGEIFVADPPSSRFMNGGRQQFPPIHTSGMSLNSQANRSSDRLYI